jgi:hypothetical protein
MHRVRKRTLSVLRYVHLRGLEGHLVPNVTTEIHLDRFIDKKFTENYTWKKCLRQVKTNFTRSVKFFHDFQVFMCIVNMCGTDNFQN